MSESFIKSLAITICSIRRARRSSRRHPNFFRRPDRYFPEIAAMPERSVIGLAMPLGDIFGHPPLPCLTIGEADHAGVRKRIIDPLLRRMR